MNKKRLIFVLLCTVCLASCSNAPESAEISSSEEVSVTEKATVIQTTQAATETATVTTTTAESVQPQNDAEVPENAVYKQTISSYNSHGFFGREVNIFDENDNVLINLAYCSENDEPPTNWTIYTYDTDDKLIKKDFYFNNRLMHYTEYEYDENDIMISDTEYDMNNGEIYEVKTEYIYDDKGRLCTEQAYHNDIKLWSYDYQYNEDDRLIKEIFNGRINSYRSYSYDENGNLFEKTVDGEYGVTVTNYTYNKNNRLIKAEDYHDGELRDTYEYEYEEL